MPDPTGMFRRSRAADSEPPGLGGFNWRRQVGRGLPGGLTGRNPTHMRPWATGSLRLWQSAMIAGPGRDRHGGPAAALSDSLRSRRPGAGPCASESPGRRRAESA